MSGQSISELLQNQVMSAAQNKRPLKIQGGGSKAFLGRTAVGELLDISKHRGIIEYDPRELVITARAGTPLSEIERTLAENGQMLAFEPPHYSTDATIGGAVASGLSGPRRPYSGSARDFLLGCKLLNGKGEIVNFGGQVMKNVAGYDVSRVMAGAWGTLGILLEVSLKVLPRPAASLTLVKEYTLAEAINYMSGMLSKALPIDAACYYKDQCYLRLSGGEQSVNDARHKLSGEELSRNSHFWQRLRDHQLSFFDDPQPLWRIAIKPATEPLAVQGDWLMDWGGAQRWLKSSESAQAIRAAVSQHGGHATAFRHTDQGVDVFQPLPQALHVLHKRLKTAFDPHGIFNPGRMYAGL